MVRLKTRWLLIRIDNDGINDICSLENYFPGKKELAFAIRDNLVQCWGVALSGAAMDTQGTYIQWLKTNKRML
jgi:hypothetical protein